MAKAIKAIQCPKCGSVNKVEIKPDFFRCSNCNTEYYLDNDDITINHNYNYSNTPYAPIQPPQHTKRVAAIVAGVAVAVLTLGIVMPLIFNKKTGSTAVQAIQQSNYRWWSKDDIVYIGSDQKPILVLLGQRDYIGSGHDNEKGKYAGFYDLLTMKELNLQRLSNIPEADIEDVKIRRFANGDIYAIANKTIIFKVNKSSMKVEDVTKTLVASQPEFVSGIANAEFTYEDAGDGFNLINNEGKNLYFYPLVNRVYTKEELSAAKDKLAEREPGAKTKTYFSFSNYGSDFPEEKLQLIKHVQKDNLNGPLELPRFQWNSNKKFGGEEEKTLLYWDADLVISMKDLTPGRSYFEPKVLYSDAEYVLINFNATPADNALTSVQCLNAETGAVVFTTAMTKNENFINAIRYKDGFIIKSYTFILVLDKQGKLVKRQDLL